jgi:hypothetical protein
VCFVCGGGTGCWANKPIDAAPVPAMAETNRLRLMLFNPHKFVIIFLCLGRLLIN